MPSGCDLYPATPPRSLSYSNQSPHKNLQQPNVTVKAPASGAKSHDTHIGLSSRQFASKNCFIEYPCARSTQKTAQQQPQQLSHARAQASATTHLILRVGEIVRVVNKGGKGDVGQVSALHLGEPHGRHHVHVHEQCVGADVLACLCVC